VCPAAEGGGGKCKRFQEKERLALLSVICYDEGTQKMKVNFSFFVQIYKTGEATPENQNFLSKIPFFGKAEKR
jgi:hypothetical protein